MSADTIRPEEPAAGGARHMGSASRHSCVWRAVHHGGLIRCMATARQRSERSHGVGDDFFGFRCVCARHTPLIDHPERSAERQN